MSSRISRTAAICLPILIAFSEHAEASGLQGVLQGFTYAQSNLVADAPGIATTTDPDLIDPWGVAFQPTGAFWVADHGKGVATLYDGNGVKVPSTFLVPPPAGQAGPSHPTGLVWNPTKSFPVPGTSLSAVFIFATLDGTISAWAPNEPTSPADAVLAVDESAKGAAYTGLAFGVTKAGGFLYAANVHTASVDVFNTSFQPANSSLAGTFSDAAIPTGFTPFGIHNVDGNLIVTYARQNAAKNFITPGPGDGYVDVFSTDGVLLQRLAAGGFLNAPWGAARAPSGFGSMSGDILIGDFGDGHIFGFNNSILPINIMLDENFQPVTLPGLWNLGFGGGAVSDPQTLFFSEGIDKGQHGLFGSFSPVVTGASGP